MKRIIETLDNLFLFIGFAGFLIVQQIMLEALGFGALEASVPVVTGGALIWAGVKNNDNCGMVLGNNYER